MADAPQPKIRLTKLDAACRHLETAIYLWFNDGEPLSIHTLAFSANKVLHGLCHHRQVEEPMLFNLKRIRKGKEKEYMRLIHAAPNFAKHADNDAEETLEFAPDANEFVIFDAVETYALLASHRTDLMTLFRFRFYLHYTHLWGARIAPQINKACNVSQLRGFSRKQFYEFFTAG